MEDTGSMEDEVESVVSEGGVALSDQSGTDVNKAVAESNMSQSGEKKEPMNVSLQRRLMEHRSSLFDISSYHRTQPCGSSITSFHEPHPDDLAQKAQNKVQYENTYSMDPTVRYTPEKVNAIIKDVLEANLSGKRYEAAMCASLCKSLSQDIKTKVKDLDFKRFKIVCLVTIGEKKDQGVRFGSRCVWDTEHDNYSSASFENAHLFAVGNVYAVYYE